MSLDAVNLLGIRVTVAPKKEILEQLQKYLTSGSKNLLKPAIIATPNPEQIVLAQADPHFRNILNKADVALPDGIGVVWALKMKHGDFRIKSLGRISGVDFMGEMVAQSAENAVPIGLIGGKNDLALSALKCLKNQHPRLNGWAENGPDMEIKNYELRIKNTESNKEDYFIKLANNIIKSKTQMLFIGMGAPRQEYFMEALSRNLNGSSVVLMSVGGTFSLISGRIPRAPVAIRRLGFEWLWRLYREPWRWKRQLSLLKFVFLVLRKST